MHYNLLDARIDRLRDVKREAGAALCCPVCAVLAAVRLLAFLPFALLYGCVSTALHRAAPRLPASRNARIGLTAPSGLTSLGALPQVALSACRGKRPASLPKAPSTCAAQHGVRPQPRRLLPSGTPHARLRPAPTSLGRVTPSPCALRLTPRKPAARIGTNSITCCIRCALSLAAGCPRRPRSGYFRCRLRCLGGARLGLVWRMAGTACDAGDSRRG